MMTKTAAKISSANDLHILRANPYWAKLPLFDHKGWKRLSFSAFAESVNERVDPSAAGDEIYVGLEHLDPQDLHIRRWGKGSDVIGTKLRFQKGDVIFGRRRAYQRKLAVAEFDGICSAHAMVVRAKPEMVLPEFLPFLMMSDRFMKRAIEISVGSLSPTINWKTLKLEEFALPPLAQQRRIAEILVAANVVENQYHGLHQSLVELFQAVSVDQFPNPTQSKSRFVPFNEICLRQPQSGLYKGPEFVGTGVKTVNMGELFGNELIDQNVPMHRMELSPKEVENYSLTLNDLLFGRRSIVLAGAGKCVMVGHLTEPTIFESSILRVTIDPNKALSGFVFDWFNSPAGEKEIKRIRSFTTIAGITGSALKKVLVPLLSIKEQRSIFDRLTKYRERIKQVKDAQQMMARTRAALLEELVRELP